MAAKAIRVGGVAAGSVQGAAELQALLKSYPQQVVADVRRELEAGAERLVSEIKAETPVSELEPHPGALRDSVHTVAGRHDLSILVVEDARDAKGRLFPAHVEYGHKAEDGTHVAPRPHFWPVVRREKRRIVSGIRAALKRAARGAS